MYLRAVGLFFGVHISCDESAAAESLASTLGRGLPSDDDSGRDDAECIILGIPNVTDLLSRTMGLIK